MPGGYYGNRFGYGGGYGGYPYYNRVGYYGPRVVTRRVVTPVYYEEPRTVVRYVERPRRVVRYVQRPRIVQRVVVRQPRVVTRRVVTTSPRVVSRRVFY